MSTFLIDSTLSIKLSAHHLDSVTSPNYMLLIVERRNMRSRTQEEYEEGQKLSRGITQLEITEATKLCSSVSLLVPGLLLLDIKE